MQIKLSNIEIQTLLTERETSFPRYVSPLINLANQYAQGTRAKIVGQMSELIKQFDGESFKEWEEWYLENNPEAIKVAAQTIEAKINELKLTLNQIDFQTIQAWVEDLVLVKSYVGLKFQEAIIRKISEEFAQLNYKLANKEEESKGIDGYIGSAPISIKPDTYTEKSKFLGESIAVQVIKYRKGKGELIIDVPEELIELLRTASPSE